MNSAKKRRVGEGGGGGEQSLNGGGLVHEELKAISSHMTNMMDMMKSMQGEIAQLKNDSNQMKQNMLTMQRTQIANYNTTMTTVLQMKNTINAIQMAQTTISQSTNSRFDDVDNKQKYHEVLLRNQQWKYSAPRLSREYWDGLDEDEDVAAEVFLSQIKRSTEEMRYGTSNGDILISAVFPYNQEFLPHWKEFANALEQNQYCRKCQPQNTITKFHLAGMDLPDAVLELLSKALESTQFTKFILQNNNLGQSGIEFASNYLKGNCILKEFSLYDNTIDNMKDIKQLCQTVEDLNHAER